MILHTPIDFDGADLSATITLYRGRYYFSLYFNMAFSFSKVSELVFIFSEMSLYTSR
jgi:hypothetical protein